MENVIIENKGDQMVLTLTKSGFDENYLISLVKRLELESLAQKSGFTVDIHTIAEQIDQEWWDANGERFLEKVKK
jgi:hypothetical protein